LLETGDYESAQAGGTGVQGCSGHPAPRMTTPNMPCRCLLFAGSLSEDDSQPDELVIRRGKVIPNGKIIVQIAEIDGHGTASVPA
jgi:hypothetical protein